VQNAGHEEGNTMIETTTKTGGAPTTLRKTRGRALGVALGVALWALQALLALQFAAGGILKLVGDPAMVEMFADIGMGQWFRYAVGALEISGAVGLLVPRLSGLAALGLVCLMVSAAATNAFDLGTSALLPLALLAVSALVAWGRRERTRALLSAVRGSLRS
jgi:putative oxidoreductase